MTPEERAEKALEGFTNNFDYELVVSRIADQIREAIWEERNACMKVAAEFSDEQVVQNVHDELKSSGMEPVKFSMAAWVGIMISRRPQP